MFRYATVAPFAMLASQWHTNHARDAKILFVKFPQAQELINDLFLLCETTKLGDKAWFIEHGTKIKVST